MADTARTQWQEFEARGARALDRVAWVLNVLFWFPVLCFAIVWTGDGAPSGPWFIAVAIVVGSLNVLLLGIGHASRTFRYLWAVGVAVNALVLLGGAVLLVLWADELDAVGILLMLVGAFTPLATIVVLVLRAQEPVRTEPVEPAPAMHCPVCGEDVSETGAGSQCPACGAALPVGDAPDRETRRTPGRPGELDDGF